MAAPSSNWMALQRKLSSSSTQKPPKKRRKVQHEPVTELNESAITTPSSPILPSSSEQPWDTPATVSSKETLVQMVQGKLKYSDKHKKPGKYVAIDCEMVGVGINGSESSLARVTIVNLYGAVLMDEYVRQQERVIDYRTEKSGIRPHDLLHARPFTEVVKQVAGLVKDRIIIGHAIQNDFKALLLSQPRTMVRDTQVYARKFKLTKSPHIALRHLVKQELGIQIQEGEHSSLSDARATMAVYRMHQKEWEAATFKPAPVKVKKTKTDGIEAASSSSATLAIASKSIPVTAEDLDSTMTDSNEFVTTIIAPSTKNQKAKDAHSGNQGLILDSRSKDRDKTTNSKGNRIVQKKGISSGLSTVTRYHGKKKEWWKELPSPVVAADGAKASLKLGS